MINTPNRHAISTSSLQNEKCLYSPSEMTDFSIVVTNQTHPSGVCIALDLLVASQRLANRLGAPTPSWTVVSPYGGTVELGASVCIRTQKIGEDIDDRSVWIVPAFDLDVCAITPSTGELAAGLGLGTQLRSHIARGGTIAAAGSASLLLAGCGLLAGKHIAASAADASEIGRICSTTRIATGKLLCVDGRILTCSHALAQCEMMLHLLKQLCGPRFSEALRSSFIRDPQPGIANPQRLHIVGGSRNAIVETLVHRVEASLPYPPSVAELASGLEVSARTLSRYVNSVTGRSTQALVQDVRLRRARTLLEQSRMSVEQIAVEVGYSDSTALRRLMKKALGSRPSLFRNAGLPA
jgi:transcriptional regulator GlxA family with amidase domain